MGSLIIFSPFGPAVRSAIAYVQTNMIEGLKYIDLCTVKMMHYNILV